MINAFFGLATLLIYKKCGPIYMHLQIKGSDGTSLNNCEITIKECQTGRIKHFVSFNNGQCHLTVQKGLYYEIQVKKFGYSSLSSCICLCCSKLFTICLDKIKGRISGTIYHDRLDKNNTLHNALVGLYRLSNNLIPYPVEFKYSNILGEYAFDNIEAGRYIIKAIK